MGKVVFTSSYHKTVFPFPPVMVFSKFVKAKVAVPFPLSHSVAVAGFAVLIFAIVKGISTGSEAQLPSTTTAYTLDGAVV